MRPLSDIYSSSAKTQQDKERPVKLSTKKLPIFPSGVCLCVWIIRPQIITEPPAAVGARGSSVCATVGPGGDGGHNTGSEREVRTAARRDSVQSTGRRQKRTEILTKTGPVNGKRRQDAKSTRMACLSFARCSAWDSTGWTGLKFFMLT